MPNVLFNARRKAEYTWKYVTLNCYEITNTWIPFCVKCSWARLLVSYNVLYDNRSIEKKNLPFIKCCNGPLASVCQMTSATMCIKGLNLANICMYFINDYDVKQQRRYIKDQHVIIFLTSWYLLSYKQKPDSKVLIKFSLLVFFYAKGPWVS